VWPGAVADPPGLVGGEPCPLPWPLPETTGLVVGDEATVVGGAEAPPVCPFPIGFVAEGELVCVGNESPGLPACTRRVDGPVATRPSTADGASAR